VCFFVNVVAIKNESFFWIKKDYLQERVSLNKQANTYINCQQIMNKLINSV
jgi:hypothetical protein